MIVDLLFCVVSPAYRYNRPVSAARIRRTAVAALLLLVAVAIVLPVMPGTPGTLRAAGVSLLWWYSAVAAPVLATLISLGALRSRSA
jgi:hypothetical protein